MGSRNNAASIRFGLLTFVGSLLFLGAGCDRHDKGFVNTGGWLDDGIKYHVLWRNGDVQFIVFCPSKLLLKTGPMAWSSSDSRGGTPIPNGISLLPEGLYVNGVLVNSTGPNKVFVVQPDRTLRAIRVVQEDLDNLSQSRIEQLEESQSWPYLREQLRVE